MAEKLADGRWARFWAWLIPKPQWRAAYGWRDTFTIPPTMHWEGVAMFDTWDDAQHHMRCWIDDMTHLGYSGAYMREGNEFFMLTPIGQIFAIEEVAR